MLERILLRNFQRWERLDVDLDPLATVFVGETDAGKSAVLRGLRWVCFNLPTGKAFVRRGSDRAKAALTAEGVVLVRAKGKSDNYYRLGSQKFQSFGQGVPAALEQKLNVLPGLNFQGQHDPPFWLCLTPGQASQELNAVVDLGLIDTTLANIASEVRKAKMTVDFTGERLAKAQEREAALSWVEEAQKDYEHVGNLYKELEDTRSKIVQVERDIENAQVIEEEVQDATESILALGNAVREGEKWDEFRRERVALQTILGDWDKWEEEAKVLGGEISRLKEELARVKECPVCGNPL